MNQVEDIPGANDCQMIELKYIQASYIDCNSMKTTHLTSTSEDKQLQENNFDTNAIGIDNNDDTIRFDIGGKQFLVLKTTLTSIPNSFLATVSNKQPCYDTKRHVFYFDRNAVLFEAILDCHRYGDFHVPAGICLTRILPELEFWRIPTCHISDCCKRRLQEHYLRECTIKDLKNEFTTDFQKKRREAGTCSPLRLNLWFHVSFPSYSLFAKIYVFTMMLLSLFSVFAIIMGSHPAFRQPISANQNDAWNSIHRDPNNSKVILLQTTTVKVWVKSMDIIINCILIIDILLRCILTPFKKKFFNSFINWMDLISSFSYIAINILVELSFESAQQEAVKLFFIKLFAALLCLRLFRIFQLAHYSTPVRVVMILFKRNILDLWTLLLLFIMGTLVFALSIMISEIEIPNEFENIVDASWWAIITMTTVGYGDMVPSTYQGYIVGGLCALTGILLSGMVIPIISNNFGLYYHFANSVKINKEMEHRDKGDKGKKGKFRTKCSDCSEHHETMRKLFCDDCFCVVCVGKNERPRAMSRCC